MRLHAHLAFHSLTEVPMVVESAEALGFDGLWSPEIQHDPFLPLALAACHSQRLELRSAVAIAFARSPGALAYTAWDLARASQGRFVLGLGSQVRAHIERRFGMPWPDSPLDKLRAFIEGLRALWDSWQNGTRLHQRSEYFKLTLMTPFFDPGPNEHLEIPIALAAVNSGMCMLAGELADHLHVHPFHSRDYLQEVILPAVEAGAGRAGRPAGACRLALTVFSVCDDRQAAFARQQIAFYAATPSYRAVMALHGWEATAEKLSGLARRGEWESMANLIDDSMLETFAVVAPIEHLAAAIQQRYAELAGDLSLYQPFMAGQDERFWNTLLADWRELNSNSPSSGFEQS
ncbi:MAG TPA: TIGR03617 family F420-dependent LLM class oxidoreductase [Anaerolineales bacterium]